MAEKNQNMNQSKNRAEEHDESVLNPEIKNESDLSKKERRLIEKEKLKGMGPKKKLEYIWMYYKTAIFGVIAVIALFSVEELDDQEYIALITVEDLESDDEEGALLLYRYNEDPEDPDTFSLDNIETDEEYETVTAVLDEILEDEE